MPLQMGMATEKRSESHGHLKQDQASRWRCPNKCITELLELSVVKREAAVFVAKLQHPVFSKENVYKGAVLLTFTICLFLDLSEQHPGVLLQGSIDRQMFTILITDYISKEAD